MAGDDNRTEIDAGPEGRKGDRYEIPLAPGQDVAAALANTALNPVVRNAHLAGAYSAGAFGGDPPKIEHSTRNVANRCAAVREGNLDGLVDMLTAQMATLDAVFTEMGRRAADNFGHYPDAADRYMSLAFKAQAGCRTTAETLARIKRDGKQTVKVVHVHEGGQAVVADTFNHGQGGGSGEKTEQAHEQSTPSAALPCPDPERDGVPLPSPKRKEAVPATRGEVSGSASGESERL